MSTARVLVCQVNPVQVKKLHVFAALEIDRFKKKILSKQDGLATVVTGAYGAATAFQPSTAQTLAGIVAVSNKLNAPSTTLNHEPHKVSQVTTEAKHSVLSVRTKTTQPGDLELEIIITTQGESHTISPEEVARTIKQLLIIVNIYSD